MLKRSLLLAGILVGLTGLCRASQTWIVAADGSGDFTEIQPAIDAALDGDLILVKPGAYFEFVLDKPLRVVGSGIDQTVIVVSHSSYRAITVGGVTSGEALVASMKSSARETLGIFDSDAVVAWNLFLDRQPPSKGVAVATVARAWLQNIVDTHQPDDTHGDPANARHALIGFYCDNFFVNQCSFHATNRNDYNGKRGGAGIELERETRAFIAETEAVGGAGGLGYWGPGCYWNYKGGPGGAGVYLYEEGDPRVDPAEAHIFGRPVNVIRGGPGGEGTKDIVPGLECDYRSPGGDGGPGVWLEAGECTIAGVIPEGGEGGIGDPPGDPGDPIVGPVVDIGLLATSTMQGTGKLGTDVTFSFHGAAGDRLVVLTSTALDILENPRWRGEPLQTSPAGQLGIFPAGTVPGPGTLSFTLSIPPDAPPGEPFYVQGVILRDGQPPILTNLSMVVTTPVWP